MIKEDRERVALGQHPVVTFGEPLVQVLTRFLFKFCFPMFFFSSVLALHFFSSPPPSRSHAPPVCSSSTPPCVDSKRPLVYQQHVHML